MKLLAKLIRRDLALMAGRPGEWLLPLSFFLLVALLLPFAIGPDVALLARLAPGSYWRVLGPLMAAGQRRSVRGRGPRALLRRP